MRLVDLLHPYLDGLERVVDLTPTTVDLRRYLLLPDGIEYKHSDAGDANLGRLGEGSLALAVFGPDPEVHGGPEAVDATIGALDLHGRAVILFGWDATTLPFHRVLDALSDARCQVIQVATLDHDRVPSAAVIEKVERLAPPRNALGEPVVAAPTNDAGRLALGIRMANEHAFGEFVARGIRSATPGHAGWVSGERFSEEHVRMQRQLNQRDARIGKLEAQLARLEGATSTRLGRTMVGAVRSPRAAVRLPLDLYRIWRKRPS